MLKSFYSYNSSLLQFSLYLFLSLYFFFCVCPLSFFFLPFYMSHLLLFHILSLFTWIIYDLIRLFFLGFSTWTDISTASSYCLGIHLDNFSSYWAFFFFFFLFFIMNEDFRGIFYCSGLSFYIKCDYAMHVIFINVGVVVESSRNLKKLPWRGLSSLGSIFVAQICLRHDPRMWSEKVLGLTNDLRFYVHHKNGLVNVEFISIVWADT